MQTLRMVPPAMRVAVARQIARSLMPYFASGINGMGYREAPGLGTVAVSAAGQLYVDLEVLGASEPRESAMMLIHEYMHVYLEHMKRFDALVRAGLATEDERKLAGIAMDLEINDGLVEAGLPATFAGGTKHICLPGNYKLPTGLVFEQYLVLLRKNPPPTPSEPSAGEGWCGSGACYPTPGELPDDPEDARRIEVMAGDVDQAVASFDNTRGRARGVLSPPTAARRRAGERTKPTKIPWQQVLAKKARRAVGLRLGMDDYTYSLPSRQQGALVWMDPMPVLPAMVRNDVQVAFVFDTSGSMGEEEHAASIAEASSILRALPGARLRVVAIDTEVREDTSVQHAAQLEAALKGGGGTYLSPAMELLDKAKPRPDIIVVATDGMVEEKVFHPPGVCVIALLVGQAHDWPVSGGFENVVDART